MAKNPKNNEVEENVEKEDVVEKPKKVTKKPQKKTMKDLRKILADAEVVVENNDNAQLFFKSKRGFEELDLPQHGDTAIISMDLLHQIKTTAKNFFEKYWIVLLDVYADDDSITLEDVYEYLGIQKLYKEIETPNNDFFNDMLIDYSLDKFEKTLSKMNINLAKQLANRAVVLAKEGTFRDSTKMNMIEETVKVDFLFEDIRNSKKKK